MYDLNLEQYSYVKLIFSIVKLNLTAYNLISINITKPLNIVRIKQFLKHITQNYLKLIIKV